MSQMSQDSMLAQAMSSNGLARQQMQPAGPPPGLGYPPVGPVYNDYIQLPFSQSQYYQNDGRRFANRYGGYGYPSYADARLYGAPIVGPPVMGPPVMGPVIGAPIMGPPVMGPPVYPPIYGPFYDEDV